MDRGAWWATVHGVAEVLDTTESVNYSDWAPACIPWLLILCSSLFQQFPPNTSNSALYFYSFFSSSFNPSSFRPAHLYSSFKAQSHMPRALWCPLHIPTLPWERLLFPPLSGHLLWQSQSNNCCCSFTKSRPTLCGPMDCSTPGFPGLHCFLEFAQTHVHGVGDAIMEFLVYFFWHCLSFVFLPILMTNAFEVRGSAIG